MEDLAAAIRQQNCISGMRALPEGSVDLVFADPPFNIGYEYDVYNDKRDAAAYLAWSRDWIGQVHRVLSATGTFWLAIGDEYAAELKIESQNLGFHCRSWVVWYYTFGVNCSRKFTRSHAHLFHFVKDPVNFTFLADDPENRVPSARQLVYADKRANGAGRLPDDTWLLRPEGLSGLLTDAEGQLLERLAVPRDDRHTFTLRPQDLGHGFDPAEDTWYFPRVAGTFKERAGFHGCQMPEQLLGRIIRICSRPGDLVLDPFAGSATTLAVAKKLGRRYLGFEISARYAAQGRARLEAIRAGDPLDGSAEPLASAPRTGQRNGARRNGALADAVIEHAAPGREALAARRQAQAALAGVRQAFARTNEGFSADRVVADPELNAAFLAACRNLGLAGDARTWNVMLLRLRKAGKLIDIPATRQTVISWEDCDGYLFASEIALQQLLEQEAAASLDEILCDPALAARFDELAARLAPGAKPFEYRWAALKLRKQARLARSRGALLAAPAKPRRAMPLQALDARKLPVQSGAYVVSADGARGGAVLYVGEAGNLRLHLQAHLGSRERQRAWRDLAAQYTDARSLQVAHLPAEIEQAGRLAWESRLARKFRARLNFHELINAGEGA